MPPFTKTWNIWAARRPLVTISLTNGVLGASGDVLAQQLSASDDTRYDLLRTLRFFGYGCMFGPVAHKWYALLDRRIPLSSHRSQLLVAAKRMAVDQLAFAPIAVAAFFGVMGKLEGKTNREIADGFERKYIGAMVGNYAIWPAAQMVNFGLVPLMYRVPFAGVVSVGWNSVLSWINSRGN